MRISDWSSGFCPSYPLLDADAAAEHDQIGDADLAAEIGLVALIDLERLGKLGGLVDFPVLLRRETDARAVGAAALVGAAEGRGRGPGGLDQLADAEA